MFHSCSLLEYCTSEWDGCSKQTYRSINEQSNRLTQNVYHGNEALAYISAMAFSLSPASMFISSFNAESLFALLTFTGMFCLSRRQYISASVAWGIASATRSNAIMYSGYFIYELVLRNYIRERSTKVCVSWRYFIEILFIALQLLKFYSNISRMPLQVRFWLQDVL